MNPLHFLVDLHTGSTNKTFSMRDVWSSIRTAVWAAVSVAVMGLASQLITILLEYFQSNPSNLEIKGFAVPVSMFAIFGLRFILQYMSKNKGK